MPDIVRNPPVDGLGRNIEPVADMTADELRGIARKLETYQRIYSGDKEARAMSIRCREIALLLDRANALSGTR